MLYPSEEALSTEAGSRLATLSDHTELGSGFAIAMRDLELRGAGDLLGDEQSGHVAAIGFELYVSLLDDAVEQLRAERRGRARTRRPCGSTSTSTPTCRPTTSRSRRRRSTSTAASPGARRAGRPARAARRAARPLRAGARAGREPVRAPARADRARRRRGAHRRGPRRTALDHPARARRGDRRPAARANPRGDVRAAHKTLSLRVPDEPQRRLAAVLGLTEALTPRWPTSRSPPRLELSQPLGAGRYAARFVSPQGKRASRTPLLRAARARRARPPQAGGAGLVRALRRRIADRRRRRPGPRRAERPRGRHRGDRGRAGRHDHERGLRPLPRADRRPPGPARGAAPRRPAVRAARRRRRLRPDALALGARRGRGARDRGHRSRDRRGARAPSSTSSSAPRAGVREVPRPIRLHAGGGATSASRCSWSPTGSSRRSCRRSRRSPRTSSARTTTRTSPSSSSPRRATSA